MTRMRSKTLAPFLFLFLALVTNTRTQELNNRPIIGVLTQRPPNPILDLIGDHDYSAFIPGSYVRYLEGAGARVAPILIHQDDAYYEKMGSSLNGILFPGGSVSITSSSGYGAAGAKLYHHAVKAYQEDGISLPIWGTCLGFQMITYLASDDTSWLSACKAHNKADNLILQTGYKDSRLFAQMSDKIEEYLRYYETTYNNHGYCVTPKNYVASGLSDNFKMLSTSYGFNGVEYMSLMEHNEMPIFGSQFHPEKNGYGWPSDAGHNAIPHEPKAVEAAQYFANFLVNQARLNNQTFPTEQEENDALIYNYNPIFTGGLGSSVTLSYLFR